MQIQLKVLLVAEAKSITQVDVPHAPTLTAVGVTLAAASSTVQKGAFAQVEAADHVMVQFVDADEDVTICPRLLVLPAAMETPVEPPEQVAVGIAPPEV